MQIGGNSSDRNCLSLQSLSLVVTERGEFWQPHTRAMERSLLALTRLTYLKLIYMWRPANGGIALESDAIPRAIALMMELRCCFCSLKF